MTEPKNFANAIMIIASIYFLLTSELNRWETIALMILIIFGLITWGMPTPFMEEKKFLEAKIKSEEARTLNFTAGSAQLIIQTKILSQGLRPQ